MNGLKKSFEKAFEVAGGPYLVGVLTTCLVLGGIWYFAQPKANPFKPMELACVDTEGKAATKDTTLRYFRDGGTIVGYDEAGMYYVYTPPQGWVCRFGETKKP